MNIFINAVHKTGNRVRHAYRFNLGFAVKYNVIFMIWRYNTLN